MYECLTRGEDTDRHATFGSNFWAEFFLLRPKISVLEAEIGKVALRRWWYPTRIATIPMVPEGFDFGLPQNRRITASFGESGDGLYAQPLPSASARSMRRRWWYPTCRHRRRM